MKRFSQPVRHLWIVSRLSAAILLVAALPSSGQAAGLQASDGQFQDSFGWSVALEGNTGLVGAIWDDGASSSSTAERGAAYLFRNLDTATGTITESVKLTASDAKNGDDLGTSMALVGNTALVGAAAFDKGGKGSAYLYRNLDTAPATVTQTAKLSALDLTSGAMFGYAISMDGTMALIGAPRENIGDNDMQGAVYLYRNLDTVTGGTINQTAKLVSSEGETWGMFGDYVSLSGNMGIVIADNFDGGSAYLYRNLDTTTQTLITEDAKFQNTNNEGFTGPASLKGTNAVLLAGANAYLYRNLDTAEGPLQEAAILSFSDPTIYGGTSLAFSGSTALIGDHYQADVGAAYLYLGLDSATGARTEDVKIIATHGEGNDRFGISVSLDGDRFIIGADGANGKVVYSGKAFYGTVSSLTTLDMGNTSRDISEISFSSKVDWIVGKTTSGNTVTLGADDRAEILAAGKAVYVGQNSGANSNILSIKGNLVANEVYIGSIDGNTGNTLRFEETASFTITTLRLAAGNTLLLKGDYADINSLLLYLGETSLTLWNHGIWETVDAENYAELISQNYSSGYTSIEAIPEPTTWMFLALGAIGFFLSLNLGPRAKMGLAHHQTDRYPLIP